MVPELGIAAGIGKLSLYFWIVVGSSVPPGTKAKLSAAPRVASRAPRIMLFLFMFFPPAFSLKIAFLFYQLTSLACHPLSSCPVLDGCKIQFRCTRRIHRASFPSSNSKQIQTCMRLQE